MFYGELTSKCDIFAVGIIVYFLQSGGSFPYLNNETLSSFRKSTQGDDLTSLVSEGDDKDFFTEEMKDFL
jgi:hypothetical protein